MFIISRSGIDTITMFKRCMYLSIRNLDAFLTGIGTPILLMLLFVYVLGGAMNTDSMNYVDFLVPGILLQCIGQCGVTTAICVNQDLQGGMIDRFRSMPIASSSVLAGHALAAIARNIITTFLILLMAYFIGFRPMADFSRWLLVVGILLLFIVAITWLSILIGLLSGSAESANGISAFIMFLPYLSSGFAPTKTMPAALRVFAEHQPMTPVVDTLRTAMLGRAMDIPTLYVAVGWCVVLWLLFYFLAIKMFQNKTSK